MKRRVLLAGLGSLALSRLVKAQSVPEAPALYVGHGGPNLGTARRHGAELAAWADTLPAASGVLAITPHVRSRGVELSAVGPGRALMSFPRSFLPRSGPQRYGSPDSSVLAAGVAELLRAQGPVRTEETGMNHTVWQPLLHMLPRAEVPVVQLALPFGFSDRELFELGSHLAPLRRRGVWLLASGNLTHNLGGMGSAEPPAWARRFDEWVATRLTDWDLEAVVDWRRAAPTPYLAHPDDGGHFDVLLVVLGAAAQENRRVSFGLESFSGGLSKRCIRIG
ncbi:MAG: class III extradiol ring-cleavage dioxygenase [Sandaracinaceae bacterium]